MGYKAFTSLAATGLLAVALLTGTADASPNLAVNGGFEAADFSGWTLTGDTGDADVADNPALAFSGSYYAAFGPTSGPVTITSAPITTVVGDEYDLSQAIDSSGLSIGTVAVGVNGSPIDTLSTGPGDTTFTVSGSVLTATSTSTVVSYTINDPDGTVNLDGISFTAVPEPATIALFGLGLAGRAGSGRRLRSRKS